MGRRGAWLLAGAAMLAVAVVAVYVWSSRPTEVSLAPIARQNVLLVTIDTLRADALGIDGGPARTPNLDALARDGVRFSFAHAHAVLTLPSHTSILTGLYPYQHGVRDNSGYRLATGTPTAATLLKQAGYATGAFVGAFPLHARFGLNAGFDVYDDRFGETRAPIDFVMPERPATAVVPLATSWIAARGDAPWFAWVHLFDPHAPYQPPAPFDREYQSNPYYGEVAATDQALGALLNQVRASGRPTMVIVTGDHGEALGDHGEATHGLFAYESTLRIPLIVAEVGAGRPSGRTAGETSPVAARHVDLVPTLLEAVGQPVPAGLPGRTLLPVAERRANAGARTGYFESMAAMLNRGWAPLSGVLANRDKFIDLPLPERYDLATDAREATNLAGQAPERDRALQAALKAFGASLPGERRGESPEALAQLRALGYVSGEAPIKARYTESDDPKRLVDIDETMHRAVDLYSRRQYREAAELYQRILARRPDMALAYRHLAFVAWEAGDVPGALEVLERALKAGVRHAGITAQLGIYLAEGGRAPEAVRLLDAVASQPQPDIDALNALGIAYARVGRGADAKRIFERLLGDSPENSMALENLGALALTAGDLATARRHFERAVQADARSTQAHAGLGVVALKSGDRKAAIAAWKEAVRLDPTNFDALYNLGTTLLGDGQKDAAKPWLEQFVRTAPPAFYGRDITEVTAQLQHWR